MLIDCNDIVNNLRIWVEKQRVNGTLYYKMCTHAKIERLADSTSLAYDLLNMIGLSFTEDEKCIAKHILDEFQHGDGFFYENNIGEFFKNSNIDRVEEMHANYLTFQMIGAYRVLGFLPPRKIEFYDQFIESASISKYLSNNCPWIRSPWGAGGMVDNLGTILKCNIDIGYLEYKDIVEEVFIWLEKHQDSKTGLWGDISVQGINGIINGGYHLMRGTYFLYNRDFKYGKQIIDTILEDLKLNMIFDDKHAHGCNDLDHFYLLFKCVEKYPDYRRDEVIDTVMRRLKVLPQLICCDDGGLSFLGESSVVTHNYIHVSEGKKEGDMQGSVFYLQTFKSMLDIIGQDNIIHASKTHAV